MGPTYQGMLLERTKAQFNNLPTGARQLPEPRFQIGDDRRDSSPPFRLLDDRTLRLISYFPSLQRVADFVRNNPHDSGLPAAASIAGMTPSAFSRHFYGRTGMKFCDFSKRVRIECALAALEYSNHSVAQLAELSGYSPCAFSRNFKQLVGTTPSEYRRTLVSGFRTSPT